MTRRQRIALHTLIGFVICTGLVLLTAYSLGADPLHPRSRHVWLLSLIAAAYVSFRVVSILERFRGHGAVHGMPDWWPRLSKKEHAIDRRMAERRARVEAAREREKETERETRDSGNE